MTAIVSRILILLTVVILGYRILVTSAGKCPSARVLDPCRCSEDRIIICGEQIKYSLKHIFHDLSRNLGKNDKYFSDFVLENSAIEEMEDNVFADILFDNITIRSAINLARIRRYAFNNTAKTVKYFEQRGDTKLDKRNVIQLFDALSSLINVRHITLELNSMRNFPTYAFTSDGQKSKVERFELRADSLTRIANYAFYELHNLKHISLKADHILRIAAHSFDFEMPSNNIINIDLRNSGLTLNSFEFEAFLGTKRPINLQLMSNGLTYLDENIFEPLLISDTRHVIDLDDNPLNCNCRMWWLLRDRDVYKSQLTNAVCNNLTDIWWLDETYFQSCNSNPIYAPILVIRSSHDLSFKLETNSIEILVILLFEIYLFF